MHKKTYKVLIVYSTNDTLWKISSVIVKVFDQKKYKVTTLPAKDTSIPHLSAADIIIFGTDDTGKNFQNGEFKELYRACTGINFAGRMCGLFSSFSLKAIEELKRMLKDTEIDIYKDPLLYTKSKDIHDGVVKSWIEGLLASFKEFLNVREF
ncbi:MAG: hypothetical protein AB1798_21815 [Spirochaetota bacterium]